MDIHLWIFIVYGYSLRNVVARISIAECHCMDIRARISMRISTLVWIIED